MENFFLTARGYGNLAPPDYSIWEVATPYTPPSGTAMRRTQAG